jgi:hypothetical protein
MSVVVVLKTRENKSGFELINRIFGRQISHFDFIMAFFVQEKILSKLQNYCSRVTLHSSSIAGFQDLPNSLEYEVVAPVSVTFATG